MTETDAKIERFFCNQCSRKTRNFIRGEYFRSDYDPREGVGLNKRMLIIECCGCENLALVKMTHFSEHVDYFEDPNTGRPHIEELWEESIYPPVTYRTPPQWFDDLPDATLREISEEIYKSLQSESHYLATFGSRTLIDRLIVLTVGDKGNFQRGLNALIEGGKISQHERDILEPVVQAGHAAAHRGWAPSKDQLKIILDTVEGLIHRLLVLPSLAEQLEEAVPGRERKSPDKLAKSIPTEQRKIEAGPPDLRRLYEMVSAKLKSLGNDVKVRPQKHYIAFHRNRNFACVQLFTQKKILRVYLNIDPDSIEIDESCMRDVRQIGHFGTGDLEITIGKSSDIATSTRFFQMSYDAS